jgi:hypothetical protein
MRNPTWSPVRFGRGAVGKKLAHRPLDSVTCHWEPKPEPPDWVVSCPLYRTHAAAIAALGSDWSATAGHDEVVKLDCYPYEARYARGGVWLNLVLDLYGQSNITLTDGESIISSIFLIQKYCSLNVNVLRMKINAAFTHDIIRFTSFCLIDEGSDTRSFTSTVLLSRSSQTYGLLLSPFHAAIFYKFDMERVIFKHVMCHEGILFM